MKRPDADGSIAIWRLLRTEVTVDPAQVAKLNTAARWHSFWATQLVDASAQVDRGRIGPKSTISLTPSSSQAGLNQNGAVKYCMSCDPATEMRPSPDAQIVECPTCGRRDLLPLLPLLVVTGASGAGKSTVFPYLVDLLPTCAVFEMDLILEYASATWDNLRSTWLMLAHGVALNGQPTVLCGSLLPDQLEALPARQLVGPIHFANLDADDHLLAQRLSARPAWRGWNEARIKEHQDFASHLRRTIEPTFSTTDADPASVASQVAAWVEARL